MKTWGKMMNIAYYLLLLVNIPIYLMEDKVMARLISITIILMIIIGRKTMYKFYQDMILPIDHILFPATLIVLWHRCNNVIESVLFIGGIVLLLIGFYKMKGGDV